MSNGVRKTRVGKMGLRVTASSRMCDIHYSKTTSVGSNYCQITPHKLDGATCIGNANKTLPAPRSCQPQALNLLSLFLVAAAVLSLILVNVFFFFFFYR